MYSRAWAAESVCAAVDDLLLTGDHRVGVRRLRRRNAIDRRLERRGVVARDRLAFLVVAQREVAAGPDGAGGQQKRRSDTGQPPRPNATDRARRPSGSSASASDSVGLGLGLGSDLGLTILGRHLRLLGSALGF